MGDGNHSMWGHLPLLVRASSKESVEYILQALWRTRRTGLDAADRQIFRDILQLPNDSDLDPHIDLRAKIRAGHGTTMFMVCIFAKMGSSSPWNWDGTVIGQWKGSEIGFSLGEKAKLGPRGLTLLVCLRVLIRRCVYDIVNKDEIQKLFPAEVLPELQRLLTLLLQKFQKEWQEDISKDQVVLPRLKSMTWNMANQNVELTEPTAVINLKLHGDALLNLGERDVKFQLAKDSMEMMLKSMYCIRDQLSEPGETPGRHIVQNSNAG
ncbi:hypothetical protein DH2020_042548 [Rehmannia glutinosa]|uniref:COMM domain-containing protein n=1 Tax=Rehmannia glutinosa TaxID=99300 RepID=A0ABR0UM50_REHGL